MMESTEQEQEERPPELTARLRLLVAQLPAIFWVTNAELRVTDVMGQVERLTGFTPSAAIGRRLLDFGGPSGFELLIDAHHRALAGVTTHLTQPLNARVFDVRVEPLRERGEPVGVVGLALDVTRTATARAKLKASQDQLALAQKLARVGSWTWTLPRNYVEWSDELYEIYGISEEQFGHDYRSFLQMVVPSDRAYTVETITRALKQKKPFDYDHSVIRGDGRVRRLRTRGAVMTGPDGEVRGLTGACWDITEQEQRTTDLEKTVAVLESTLESTADGVLVVDADGHVVAHNDPFLKIWGIPPGPALGDDEHALLDAAMKQLEDPRGFLDRVQEIYARPDSAPNVETIRFKDGRIIERRTRPFRLPGGAQRGRVWTFRDVTEEQQLLSRALFLADASRLLATLDVEAALQAVVNSLVPRFASAAACDLVGDDGEPRRIAQVTEPGVMLPERLTAAALQSPHVQLAEFRGSWAAIIPVATRGRGFGALTLLSRRGHYVPAETVELMKELAHRSALAFENARLYRQAEQAVRNREEFLSVVAHEIRGPLTTMHLGTQALLKGGIPDEQKRRVLEMLEREDRRISGFVDDLLELGRIQSGRFAIRLEEVNLGEVVSDVVAKHREQISRSGSEVRLALQKGVTGTWDRGRLDQVVSNLLSNAIKYGEGKQIEISVKTEGDQAKLRVADQGIGVPSEKIPQLFQPFERAVSSRQYGGLGLGLFIVKTVVDQLGGSVQVQSARDQGATFEVVLPRSRSQS